MLNNSPECWSLLIGYWGPVSGAITDVMGHLYDCAFSLCLIVSGCAIAASMALVPRGSSACISDLIWTGGWREASMVDFHLIELQNKAHTNFQRNCTMWTAHNNKTLIWKKTPNIHIHVYIHTCVYIYIHVYIDICIFSYVKVVFQYTVTFVIFTAGRLLWFQL